MKLRWFLLGFIQKLSDSKYSQEYHMIVFYRYLRNFWFELFLNNLFCLPFIEGLKKKPNIYPPPRPDFYMSPCHIKFTPLTLSDNKQYWHFPRVAGKQYYQLFQISYHYQTIHLYLAVLTFSESYFQIKL